MFISSLYTAATYINDQPPSNSPPPSGTPTMTESTANATDLNYKYAQKINGSIKDRFTIDPFIQCETGGKENLMLEAKNGEIDADVTLIGAKSSLLGDSNLKKYTNLVTISHNGGIRYKLRKSESENTLHPPFFLKLHCFNGKVRVFLPSKFSGVIKICALNGAIKFPNQPSTLRGPEKLGSTKIYRIGSDSSANDDKLVIKANNGEVEVTFFDDVYIGGETAGRGGSTSSPLDRVKDFGRYGSLGGPAQESESSSGGGNVGEVIIGSRGSIRQSSVGGKVIIRGYNSTSGDSTMVVSSSGYRSYKTGTNGVVFEESSGCSY